MEKSRSEVEVSSRLQQGDRCFAQFALANVEGRGCLGAAADVYGVQGMRSVC